MEINDAVSKAKKYMHDQFGADEKDCEVVVLSSECLIIKYSGSLYTFNRNGFFIGSSEEL